MSSLEVTDAESAAVAVAPRVSLDDIEVAIDRVSYCTGLDLAPDAPARHHEALKVLTICLIVMKNGFMVIGESAPTSPDNFNRELGKVFAYENAVRKLWPLMGFALRDKLAKEKTSV